MRELDHVGLIVADLDASERTYAALGFAVRYRERIADQDVDVIGMTAGDSTIELLKPLSADSPLERFRAAKNSRIHHFAYRVEDIRAELVRLDRLGIKLIDKAPRHGAHGNLVAFIHPSATGDALVELCQRLPEGAAKQHSV